VTEMISSAPEQDMNALVSALVEVESFAARRGWGQPPQLYALASRSSLLAADQELESALRDAPPGSLIPVEQTPLPPGDPMEFLGRIHWPDEVFGCVLVTEAVLLPPDAEPDIPGDPTVIERWANTQPGRRQARLVAGACRDGQYAQGYRFRDEDEILVGGELADDLVVALLGTF
jgi:hypothetical protein